MKSAEKWKRRLILFSRCELDREDFGVIAARFRHAAAEYPDAEHERNCRNFFKFTYVESGSAEMFCNDNRCLLTPGKAFLLHPDDLTSYRVLSESLTVINVLFFAESIEGIAWRDLRSKRLFAMFEPGFSVEAESSHVRIVSVGGEVEHVLKRLVREHRHPGADSAPLKRALLQTLLLLFAREQAAAEKRSRSAELVDAVKAEVERAFPQDFDFRGFAARWEITLNHLCLVFRRECGETISRYQRGYRIEEAAKLLAESELSVTEIAFKCGFRDLSYFYRTFREIRGMNPGEYRKAIGLH